MVDRCVVHDFKIETLDSDIGSPAFAGLLRDGWTVLGTVVVKDGNDHVFRILLGPPQPVRVPSAPPWLYTVVGMVVGAVAVLVGLQL